MGDRFNLILDQQVRAGENQGEQITYRPGVNMMAVRFQAERDTTGRASNQESGLRDGEIQRGVELTFPTEGSRSPQDGA